MTRSETDWARSERGRWRARAAGLRLHQPPSGPLCWYRVGDFSPMFVNVLAYDFLFKNFIVEFGYQSQSDIINEDGTYFFLLYFLQECKPWVFLANFGIHQWSRHGLEFYCFVLCAGVAGTVVASRRSPELWENQFCHLSAQSGMLLQQPELTQTASHSFPVFLVCFESL